MTFKSVLNLLKDFGNNHQQIQRVEWGKLEEITNSPTYPMMFIQPLPGEVLRHQNTDNFTIHFLDKMEADYSNREDVFNDMKLLCNDLTNFFDIDWFNHNHMYIEEGSTFDFIDGEMNDIVGGISLTIKCVSNYDIDCLAPITPQNN